MKIEWDFSELNKFADNLKDTHNFETAIMTATQNITRVLHKYIVDATPVDTGNLRKMWSAGDNLMFTVEKGNGGYQVKLINRAINKRGKKPYMYPSGVEDGHWSKGKKSWVVGRLFVRDSILKLTESKRIENIVYKELQKWWRNI